MISRQEILRVAGVHGLGPHVVEKDYVLGWVLAGIYSHDALRNTWIFKGGTCLRKCYFETYRFSEDLDFTLAEPFQTDNGFLVRVFSEIGDWIYGQTGIEIPRRLVKFEAFANQGGLKSSQGKIGYRGPIGPRSGYRSLPRIKLDVTLDELIVVPPVECALHHDYSDESQLNVAARTYALEEAYAEKVRALGQRARPRDLYDVINLYRNHEARPNRAVLYDLLQKKCSHRGISVPTLADLQERRTGLEFPWGHMLKHQLQDLPPFESYFCELPEFFHWLEAGAEPSVPAAYQMAVGETVLRDRSMHLPVARAVQAHLEVIRFAAANHLCVDLRYLGSVHRIEPYSLRRAPDGSILLHAVRVYDGEHRSYRIDQIRSASTTQQSFVPRYLVELRPKGRADLSTRTHR